MSFAPELLEAARFERDRRAQRYPTMVRDGKKSAEDATVDYQAWCAIVSWFETGHLLSIGGGLNGQAIVDWAVAEAAAERVLAAVAAKDEEHVRIANLRRIHRAVQLRRGTIDSINAEPRGGRKELAA